MSTTPTLSTAPRTGRLFVASCCAIAVNGVMFAVIGDIMNPLKQLFVLTNQQAGFIGGAQFWGVTVSILIAGPLCDALGMRLLLRLAFVCHLIGVLMMILAGSFAPLFLGSALLGVGNGLVQGACNPLIATLYPGRMTEKMNHLHAWFPGGIVIAGLICFAMTKIGLAAVGPLQLWQTKLVMILVPTLGYGLLFTGQSFPATERVQSGVSFGGMFAATFGSPIFLVLSLCMVMTASLELGPNSWMPAVLGSAGISGILLLVWITGLMFVVRQFAGPIIHRLAPTGVLLVCSILAGIGLYWLSFVTTTGMAFAASFVFAIGVSMFWPTMVGYTAERVPRGGALAISLISGIGCLASGLIAAPQMGNIGDRLGHTKLDVAKTTTLLAEVTTSFPALAAKDTVRAGDYRSAADDCTAVLKAKTPNGELPAIATANALRAAARMGSAELGDRIKKALDPAENYGGRMSFRYVAVLGAILTVIFGILHATQRKPASAVDEGTSSTTRTGLTEPGSDKQLIAADQDTNR